MTAREYLDRPETLRKEIRRKQMRIKTLRRLATRFSAGLTKDRVKTTPDPARMQAFLSEAADEERQIRILEDKRLQALADTALLISRLPEEKLVRMMEMRYLDRFGWDEITVRLGCASATVFRLHQLALDLLTPPPETEDEKTLESCLKKAYNNGV